MKRSEALGTSSRSSRRHEASRRRALGALLAGASLLVVRPATATPEELTAALRETFGDRPVNRGRVKLELPRLAENGSVVPVTVSVDSPMTEQEYVQSIHLFAEKNHLPRILEVQLGPYNGKAVVASRVRMATSQQLTAVAVLSDGSLWSAAADIEVVTSECGL
ncbi:MAG TPA: thiosulfate oxidation carrier protein SoxY [Burkholderiales bacterium]|nr:thiosulfate oxidation carrier protein SoxY [Burkholderiales bacterium]